MTDHLPDPLVTVDVQLQDFAFVPLYILRLRRSKAWLICKRRPELAFYLMNLWMHAWHESPAGSIEDDPDVLADAAMCTPRQWPKLRDDLLRGWIRCSDGRLYHPVVAELAKAAYAEKLAHRARTKAATDARRGGKKSGDGPDKSDRDVQRQTPDGPRNDNRDDERNVHQGKDKGKGKGEGEGEVREREGKEKPEVSAEAKDATGPTEPAARADPATEGSLLGAMSKALRDEGVIGVTPSHPTLVGWQQAGIAIPTLREAVDLARDRKPKPQPIPVAYLEPIVAQLLQKPTKPVNGSTGNLDWWSTTNGILAEAARRKIPIEGRDPSWLRCAIAVSEGGDTWPWIDPRNGTQERVITELREEGYAWAKS